MDCDACNAAGQTLAVKTVLFLCTGNYYRSRFAEILFNHLLAGNDLDWRAASRGLAPDKGINVGPISMYALHGLKARGIALGSKIRYPLPVTEADLADADLIVALKESEHRPMLEAHFPVWAEGVEYWHIDDLDCASPEEALTRLEDAVVELMNRLRRPVRPR
ncbi:MAG: low molecular weight phosphatase family protein [Thermoguttaceae bacterium]